MKEMSVIISQISHSWVNWHGKSSFSTEEFLICIIRILIFLRQNDHFL